MDFESILEDLEKKPEKQPEIKTKKRKENVFDYINQVDLKTNSLKFDKKLCSTYIMMLHYSHQSSLIEMVNDINFNFNNIESKYVYEYLFYKMPKGKKFIKWIKKDKEKNDIAEKLMLEYNISYREALESII